MFITKVIGDLGEKRRWRQYKARAKQLPPAYRAAIEACERYLMIFGSAGNMSMYEDLVDLFEQSATDGTPIRVVVGEDPVEFIETFAGNYKDDSWMNRERDKLTSAIDRAARDDGTAG
ncbi:DNA-binding ferritin-like protein (Dps family) [Nocardia mexicana]|uniref:DNA-binding ferritin-like protein (Dps family) n=2 Tax=Nocardia mexicana TaxID=279262 RepID=A0A370GI89_9NOCA|nr:DUF1048 domain-containing protein [Nocardia mexicana]RDI42889.1 DNA-binding ferritin-like protein (Dps family) [Nocardia mexicana]